MFKVIDTLRSDLNKAGGELVDILVDNANGKKKRVCDIVDSARSFIRNDGASQNVDYSSMRTNFSICCAIYRRMSASIGACIRSCWKT